MHFLKISTYMIIKKYINKCVQNNILQTAHVSAINEVIQFDER